MTSEVLGNAITMGTSCRPKSLVDLSVNVRDHVMHSFREVFRQEELLKKQS